MSERVRVGRVSELWEKEKRVFLEERRLSVEEWEKRRKGGEARWKKVESKEKKRQKKERWERINSSEYNGWYKEVKEEGISEYLKKNWGKSKWKRVAIFRLGSMMREGKYWKREEKRRCRMCGRERETWKHVWEECREWRKEGESWQEVVREMLGEKGEGEWWMKKIEREKEWLVERKGKREKEE